MEEIKNMIALVTLILHVFVLVQDTDGFVCDSGFTHHANSCYHFSHDKEPWMLAQLICKEMGGYLVEVTSRNEESFLIQELNRLPQDQFWIGGNDLQVEGEWLWWPSKHKLTGFTDWSPGSPSNSNGNENCIELHKDGAYKWNDDACSKALNYICEAEEAEIVAVG